MRQRNQRCSCCSKEAIAEIYVKAKANGGQVDHIIPVSLGGAHCLKNLQILTVAEHKEKTARDKRIIAAARMGRAA